MFIDIEMAAFATELAYATQTVGNSSESMPGYVVDRVFDDLWDNTGFYAVSFCSEAARHTIVAIRGTQDRLDLIADANVGIGQYVPNRPPLLEYIGANVLGHRVTVAGHSLGGALSQYLGYDFAREFPGFRTSLTVHTHNGLGGIAGIAKMHGAYDRSVVEGITFRNYRHPEDPVSRIGGQVGGNVFNIADPDPLTNGLFFAHANQRFLRRQPPSVFESAQQAMDDAFELSKSLAELAPELSQALALIVHKEAPIEGAQKIYRLLGRVPPHERRVLARLLGGVLPFRRLWEQSLGRVLRRPNPTNPR